MLVDAFVAELYKLVRHGSVLFWGFLFIPVAWLLFDVAVDVYAGTRAVLPYSVLNLGDQAAESIIGIQSPFVQVFFGAGAASIFGDEYKWETWRLILPKNRRVEVLIGKLIAYAFACIVAAALIGTVSVANTIYSASAHASKIIITGDGLVHLLQAFSVSAAVLLLTGSLTAIVCILTKSGLAALMTVAAYWLVQFLLLAQISPSSPKMFEIIMLPMLASQVLDMAMRRDLAETGQFIGVVPVACAVGTIFVWYFFSAVVAIALFNWQDITQE